MPRVHYGEIAVDFTDGEYQRLQEIRQNHFDDPEWRPPAALTNTERCQLSVEISKELRERMRLFAKRRGVTMRELMHAVAEVLT